jgi:hypothetical protein
MGPCSCRGIIRTIHELVLNTPVYDETTKVLRLLHPPAKVDLPLLLNDFHPEIEVTLDQKAFFSTLARSPHLSFGGPLSIVYEFL